MVHAQKRAVHASSRTSLLTGIVRRVYKVRVMHLSAYMAANNLTDNEVASAIRRSRPTVSRIRRKLVRPDWGTIKNIEEFTGGAVTASDFTDIEAEAAA